MTALRTCHVVQNSTQIVKTKLRSEGYFSGVILFLRRITDILQGCNIGVLVGDYGGVITVLDSKHYIVFITFVHT